MRRTWIQWTVTALGIEDRLQRSTDNGWTIFAILPLSEVRHEGIMQPGAIIVAWKDDPDLSVGVSR